MDHSRGTVDDVSEHARGDVTKSLVSVVILTHNQIDYTKACIEGLVAHIETNLELIVVDNGSVDGTCEYLEEIQAVMMEGRSEMRVVDFRFIRNRENFGFAAGNNQGISAASGDYIVLVNNDVVVTPGWLSRMLACVDRSPQIGIVGPMTNYVSGAQLVANVSYDPVSLDGLWEFARRFSRHHEGQAERSPRVVGFCMLIKRAVIERIGGLDERFGLGNFEDDDFCLRAALAGFESWIVKDCFVHHFGSRTFLGANIDYVRSLQENWQIFKSKWRLPHELAYGRPYDVSRILQSGFDPPVHYVPLGGNWSARPAEGAASMDMTDEMTETLLEGERLFEQGRYDEAERLFKKVVSVYPDHPDVRIDLACVHWKRGRSLEALQELYEAMRIDPANRDAVWNFGQFLSEWGHQGKAEALYASYLEQHPDDREMREALNGWQKRCGANPEHTSAFTASVDTEARLAEGQALLREGHLREAQQVYRAIIRSSADHVEAHEDLARVLWESGQAAEALVVLGRALELNRHSGDARDSLWQFLLKLDGNRQGDVSNRNADSDAGELQTVCCEAVQNLQGTGQGYPMDRALGRACRQAERFVELGLVSEAKELLWGILEGYADCAEAYNDLAFIHWNEGDAEGALREMARAVELAPDHADIVWNCGHILMGLGKNEKAMTIFSNYLKRHPEADDFREMMAAHG